MTDDNTNNAEALALSALVWILQDDVRAERLLALTGLSAGDLRARAADRALLAEVLGFLGRHEPDLFACAKAIDTTPLALIAAQRALETA